MSTSLVECTPHCESFRCTQGKGTLKFRTRGGKKLAWCTSFDDECDGAWCQYKGSSYRRPVCNTREICKEVTQQNQILSSEFGHPASSIRNTMMFALVKGEESVGRN